MKKTSARRNAAAADSNFLSAHRRRPLSTQRTAADFFKTGAHLYPRFHVLEDQHALRGKTKFHLFIILLFLKKSL